MGVGFAVSWHLLCSYHRSLAMHLNAHILLATPETDARLRAEQNTAGAAARSEGRPRTDCPHDPQSLIASWWFEGYDQKHGLRPDMASASAA
jgi:hypothetical protein